MQITVNGQEKKIEATTLSTILRELGYEENDIVVAVNCEFVPRAQWNAWVVQPADNLDILTPIIGGG